MTCPTCGNALVVGEWPWCPHGFSEGLSIIDDQLEGGPRRFETMGDDAPYIASKSEWRREIAARGLVHVDRHDRAYFDRKFKEHQEHIADTGYSTDGLRVRES